MMISVPEGQERRWFAAGETRLALDTPQSKAPAAVRLLNDAVLLDEHEPLLQCIASWCNTDFDWLPAAGDDEHSLAVTLQSNAGRDQQAGLVMPEDVLTSLPPFPDAFTDLVSVCWHATQASLLLDRVKLSAEEVALLVPGSLLLLPASYADLWHAEVVVDEVPERTAHVFVQPATGVLSFDQWRTREVVEPAADDSFDVYLDTRIPIDLNEWLTASEAGGVLQSTDGFFLRSLRITGEQKTLTASLMLIGDGYGAVIDAIDE